jgi:hypothetical protein
MKTRIKTLIAFVMLSGALLPITFALPDAQSNTNAQTAPQVTAPGIVLPNDQSSGAISLSNGGPRIDSTGVATSIGAASGAVPSVPDTDVRLLGTVSYQVNGTNVHMHVDDVANYASGGTSGTLKLQLWATYTPYNGGNIQGYVFGEYILGTLPGGYHFYNVDVNVPFTSPPAGTYWITMTLDEYQNPYVIVNWRTFSNTQTFGNGPNPTISQYFPYAFSVGGNWYWDDQIGYIYPYSNGVCYFYTYGRFYYPGAGSFGYSTAVYIYDYNYASWTYTSKSLWPWVYYFRFGQWYSSDFH